MNWRQMVPPSKLDLFTLLACYDSATISNAIESFDVRPRTEGFMDATVRCLYPGLPAVAGRAVTCVFENSDSSLSMENKLPILFDVVRALPDPAIVVCQYVGSDGARCSLVGDLVSAFLHKLGAIAIVTDSGARDIDMIQRRAPGFQVFASGVVASHGAGRVVDVGNPVSVGGLRVASGDILHADANGVVAVPSAVAEHLPAAAARVIESEDALQHLIRAEPLNYEKVRDSFAH
jgi:4-hydroxy-4-methyl-2-oxoglutarate aldolase